MMFSLNGINWVAVVAAVVASMIIGALWYSKMLFAAEWMKLIGKSEKELKENATTGYAIAVVLGLIEAIFMSVLLKDLGTSVQTLAGGATVGLFIWIGFIAPPSLMGTIFAGKRKKLWAIDYGSQLVIIVAMGAIIGTLMK